jgi:hypothetical protein
MAAHDAAAKAEAKAAKAAAKAAAKPTAGGRALGRGRGRGRGRAQGTDDVADVAATSPDAKRETDAADAGTDAPDSASERADPQLADCSGSPPALASLADAGGPSESFSATNQPAAPPTAASSSAASVHTSACKKARRADPVQTCTTSLPMPSDSGDILDLVADQFLESLSEEQIESAKRGLERLCSVAHDGSTLKVASLFSGSDIYLLACASLNSAFQSNANASEGLCDLHAVFCFSIGDPSKSGRRVLILCLIFIEINSIHFAPQSSKPTNHPREPSHSHAAPLHDFAFFRGGIGRRHRKSS